MEQIQRISVRLKFDFRSIWPAPAADSGKGVRESTTESWSAHRLLGFTLLELLVVIGISAFLISVLAPAFARTRIHTKTVRCLNNLRQVTRAWSMYAADNSDRVANNFGIAQTEQEIQTGSFGSWANNVMTWGAGSSFDDKSNTNLVWLEKGVLRNYLGGETSVYQCPADTYLSPLQVCPRLERSCSQHFYELAFRQIQPRR